MENIENIMGIICMKIHQIWLYIKPFIDSLGLQ